MLFRPNLIDSLQCEAMVWSLWSRSETFKRISTHYWIWSRYRFWLNSKKATPLPVLQCNRKLRKWGFTPPLHYSSWLYLFLLIVSWQICIRWCTLQAFPCGKESVPGWRKYQKSLQKNCKNGWGYQKHFLGRHLQSTKKSQYQML